MIKLYYLVCAVSVIYFVLPVYGQSKNFCTSGQDCTVEGTTCQNGLCFCEVGKVFSTDGTKCLDIAPGIGYPCEDSTQCSLLISGPAVCDKFDLCSCAADHVFLDNKCQQYRGFNETCTENTPCYDGVDLFAMECSQDGTCVCSEGYYARGAHGCRLAAMKNVNNTKECFLDIDCQDENQYCHFNLTSWGPLGNCTDRSTRNKPEKPTTKIYMIPEVKLKPSEGNANLPCHNDADCKSVQNSFCAAYRQKCTCKTSFIFDKYSGHCVRALGASCSATEPKCGVKYAECNKNNVCQCPKYFIYSANGDKCIKPTRQFSMHSCGSDENCYAFGPYATCTKANETDLITTCNCKTYSKFDEQWLYCVPEESGQCKNNCEDKLHSECVNGVCQCRENYIEDNLQCLPNIGAECSTSKRDCNNIEFATCHPERKICECNEGYFQNGPRACLKEIETPEGCVSDIQCVNLLDEGGICVNKTCSCAETHVYDEQDAKCIRKRTFGDQCTSLKHCATMLNSENVFCLKGKCVCDYDYQFSQEKSQCVYNAAPNPIHGQFIFFVVLLLTTLIFFF